VKIEEETIHAIEIKYGLLLLSKDGSSFDIMKLVVIFSAASFSISI